MTRPFALSLGLLGFGLSASASALTVEFHFNGAGNALAAAPLIAATNITDNTGTVNGTSLTYTYVPATGSGNVVGGFSDFAGSGVLGVVGGAINFTFVGATDAEGDLAGGILSFSGGTGVLAGQNGTGLVSHSVSSPTTVDGQFQAELVPEPASLAALGVGAVALLRRRSRKSN